MNFSQKLHGLRTFSCTSTGFERSNASVYVPLTILIVVVNQGWRVGRWKTNITASEHVSLANANFEMAAGRTKRLVEEPPLTAI
jgi:hypothetical protein